MMVIKTKKTIKISLWDRFYWILAFLPLIVTGVVFPAFPLTIPAHFNSLGQPDRYGSRGELFIFPVMMIGIAVFFWFFFLFISRQTKGGSEKIVQASKMVVVTTFSVISIAILLFTYRFVKTQSVPDLEKITAVLLSLGDIILANYLPKCRRNGWAGIRTSFTMKSDEIWYKTHRFGGRLIAAGGILSIVVLMFLKGVACLMFVFVWEFAMLALIIFYSYQISKREGSAHE